MLINTPISLGELVDKISILLIKQKNINDKSKILHVNKKKFIIILSNLLKLIQNYGK